MRARFAKFLRNTSLDNRHTADKSALVDAFRAPLGQFFLSVERARIAQLLEEYRGAKILHLSVTPDQCPDSPSPFRAITHVFNADSREVHTSAVNEQIVERAAVEADFDALPFESESFDIVIVQHALEFDKNPHGATREAARVTKPLGHMMILAFNPVSLSGLVSVITKRFRSHSLWCRRALLGYRLRDWLHFVDFNCLSVENLGHCVPVNSSRVQGLNQKVSRVLGRINAPFASVICIVARKDQFNMLLSERRWQKMRAAQALFVPSPTATTRVAGGESVKR